MQTFTRNTLKLIGVLMLVASLIGSGSSRALAASLPASSACTEGAGTATCNLWAKAGTFTPPVGTSAAIWGYTDSAGGTLTAPGGPVLVVNQNDVVTVNLTNNLSESTSLLFQGQDMVPDTTTGAAPTTGTKSYTFTAKYPGTFLYEAGLRPGMQHQTAMGLYGALVVRPSVATQAYADSSTAFNEEALVVLSELDPALNNSATPANFDMRKYSPKYFLINGKTYPNTDAISVTAGNKVLLRYVNAGLQAHAMGVLGFSQKIVGQDGSPYTIAHSMVSETIATGQTLDAIVTIPASAVNGTQFALYDANMLLHNSNTAGMGGMLTFLTVGVAAPPADTGPFVSLPGLSPASTNGTSNVTVSATISDAGTLTVNNIAAAEFYIDSTAGTANPMTYTDAGFDSPTESVTGTIPMATIAAPGFLSGNHTIYIRGRDSAGTWSSFLSVVLNVDKTGPVSSALALSPNPSSGAFPVDLTATGNDTASGNSNVTAAEYWVDGGSHVAMTIVAGPASATRNFTAIPPIPAGLAQGTHVVSVRSQDSFGNWGPVSTVDLIVTDSTPPTTVAGSISASPNPNNGTMPFNVSVSAVRVTASFSDVSTGNSNIVAAEGFIGDFGTASSATSSTLLDASKVWITGQWVGLQVHITAGLGSGQTRSITANTATSLTVSPAWTTTPNGTSQYAIDLGGATGTGFAFVATNVLPNDGQLNSPTETAFADIPLPVVNALSSGPHPICVHAKDSAGNWGARNCSYNLIITAPTVSSISRIGANPTNAASVQFLVTFSESMTGVSASNFALVRTGLSGTTSITSVVGGGATWTVTASTGNTGSAGVGTLGLNMTSATGVVDSGNNALTGTPFTGQVFTVDRSTPTLTSITLAPTSVAFGTSVGLTLNGFTDPGGNGVTGGEYWFDGSTNITPGTGTQFSGTSGLTVATSSLTTLGAHSLRVRVRDAAGNWSTPARTATLTVTAPDAIFSDGFESPTTLPGNWTSRSTTSTTRLNNTTTAALFGLRGLQAQGNNTNYVQFNFGTGTNPVTGTFDARFYFNPNNNASTGQDIFAAATSNAFTTQLFHVRYRRSGTQPQVQIQVGATTNASWVNITNNASNRIEVVWQSGTSLQLYVNGVLSQTLTASAGTVGSFRLGSVTSGGSSTNEYFDAFASKRSVSPLIGP